MFVFKTYLCSEIDAVTHHPYLLAVRGESALDFLNGLVGFTLSAEITHFQAPVGGIVNYISAPLWELLGNVAGLGASFILSCALIVVGEHLYPKAGHLIFARSGSFVGLSLIISLLLGGLNGSGSRGLSEKLCQLLRLLDSVDTVSSNMIYDIERVGFLRCHSGCREHYDYYCYKTSDHKRGSGSKSSKQLDRIQNRLQKYKIISLQPAFISDLFSESGYNAHE